MPVLSTLCGLEKGGCAAIVGSGGKTTLLWRLAEENRHNSVLVSTTTKMRLPDKAQYDRAVWAPPYVLSAGAGITVAARYDAPSGKIAALPPSVLADLQPSFDHTILECDGSKQRPLKGWADYEPVVPALCTVTLGVLPLSVVGQPVCHETVHRLDTFAVLTGAVAGDTVTVELLGCVVRKGLFAAARGRRVLYLSHAAGRLDVARRLAALCPEELTVLAGDIGEICEIGR